MAVVAGDHEDLVLEVLYVLQRNTGVGKRMTLAGADDDTGNAEKADAFYRQLRRRLSQEMSGSGED